MSSSRQIHNIFFFCYQQFFFFFSHNTTNPKYNKTKQQKHTQHLKVQAKGRRKDNKNTKVTPLYNHVYSTKKLPSINGRRPAPDSRRCTFTRHYLQEATDPICFSTHVWCKPVLDYCLLHSCKTSKQHSLLHWTNTETWIIIKKIHNIFCWLEILNYCPDGGNGNCHCSSSFLKATSLICEAQLSFAAHQKYILCFFSLWWMIKGIWTLFSLLFIFLWNRKPWLDNFMFIIALECSKL